MSTSERTAADTQTPATRVVVVGGGPGGYEAALVAAQLGADVTLVESQGLGGNAVITDVVPSKTLIATAEVMNLVSGADELGVLVPCADDDAQLAIDLKAVNTRVRELAKAQSDDIHRRMGRDGVTVVDGHGRLLSPSQVEVTAPEGSTSTLDADVVLLAVGTYPRELDSAKPDGERILTWKQLYCLDELPSRLVVVGSGVTGAEFANAYDALGAEVVLVSSRDQVLPGNDKDAAKVIEEVFERRGVKVMANSRADAVTRTENGVEVRLADGTVVEGSHCLMAVGSIPSTTDLGLDAAGVKVDDRGYIIVDRVSRTSARGVYAAGDCTGVMPLASVAAMQGRIAMWHAMGDAVTPLDLRTVASNIFTEPEIAAVGVTQEQIEAGEVAASVVTLPLSGNARAKMQGIHDGFVKLFSRTGVGTVIGGVVVAPRASELIFPVTLAVDSHLTVDQVAHAFTIYPSLSGSVAEAARRLHGK